MSQHHPSRKRPPYLQRYGVGTIATSSLGLGNNTFLTHTDTIASYSAGGLLFETANSVTHDPTLVFTNGNLGIGTTSPYARLSVGGSVVASNFVATSGVSILRGLTVNTLNCTIFVNGGKVTTDTNGNLVCMDDEAGDGSGAAGLATQIQFNSGNGVFGASSNFTWNSTTNTLTVTGTTTTSVLVATGATSTITRLSMASASTTVLRNTFFFQNGMGNCSSETATLFYNGLTGTFSCGTDGGFGVATNVWSTTTNDGAVYPTSNSFAVIIGASATTTYEKLEIRGNASGDYYSATKQQLQPPSAISPSPHFCSMRTT